MLRTYDQPKASAAVVFGGQIYITLSFLVVATVGVTILLMIVDDTGANRDNCIGGMLIPMAPTIIYYLVRLYKNGILRL